MSVAQACFISSSPPQEVLCQTYVERAIALLKSQNEMVATHSNSHIYSQLLTMVDFEGYYLENKPCLVCNDPEVPYSVSWRREGRGGEEGRRGRG